MTSTDEVRALKQEYRWLLKEEVHQTLKEVLGLLLECCRRFPGHAHSGGKEISNDLVKPERFLLSSTNGAQNIKCMVTLLGDNICEADIQLKLHKDKTHSSQHRSCIQPDKPWKLQQIQDAGNHLLSAMSKIESYDETYSFKSRNEVLFLVDSVMDSLNKGRTSLILPKRKSLDELVNNRNIKHLNPLLPQDYVISFYIHAQKLVMALYHIHGSQTRKLEMRDRCQVECPVPWFNEVIILFTLALEMCQQLKDKVSVFSQYSDDLR